MGNFNLQFGRFTLSEIEKTTRSWLIVWVEFKNGILKIGMSFAEMTNFFFINKWIDLQIFKNNDDENDWGLFDLQYSVIL